MKRGSMRSPIPSEIREQLSQDPFMSECILFDAYSCEGRVTWQHAFQYASKRRNELWAILPMCVGHHRREATYKAEQEAAMRYRIKNFGAEADFAAKYPRSNLLKHHL